MIWHFRAKNDYKVSYPGISPGMIKPPLEPTRWLWSSPRLKQAVIQKRCSVVFHITKLQCSKFELPAIAKNPIFLTSIFVLPFYNFELIMTFI